MSGDFLTDEEMEQHEAQTAPQAPHVADFLTDEQMAQMSPEAPQGAAPVLTNNQMNRMANPNHAAVNAMLRDAVSRGSSVDEILQIAHDNGVSPSTSMQQGIANAVKWRKQHGSYNGYVDAFGEPATDEHNEQQQIVRKTPKNDVGALDALGEGVGQGLTAGFDDEIGAAVAASANSLGNLVGLGNGQDFGDFYRDDRDARREMIDDADSQHPYLFNGGQIVGTIAPSLIGGAPATGARLLGRAALEGGLIGAGQSKAETVGGVAQDVATTGAVSALTAGTLNRVGAALSPKIAPLVARLLGEGVTLTPSQILKAGGPVARAIGHGVEAVGRRGAVTSEAMRNAERRGADSLDAVVARQDAAVAAAQALGLNARPRHPDLLTNAESVMGKRTRETSQIEMLGNLLLGYASSGSSLAADLGMAAAYTKPGQAIATSVLTGRQGPVPKAIRGIAEKLSPLAGRAAAINTPHTEQ